MNIHTLGFVKPQQQPGRGCSRLFTLVISLALPACAFSRPGVVHYGPLVARADSLAVGGDTTGALVLLDSAVRLEPSNALAWHRRGMLAWAKGRPNRRLIAPTRIENLDLLRTADTSLRLAHRLAPDSGRYALDLGRYFLYADLITLRIQAAGRFSRALDAGRRVGDSALVAAALDEIGMVHWRRYESVADRRLLTGLDFVQAEALAADARNVGSLLTERSVPMKPPAGLNEYRVAVAHFEAALGADPTYRRASQHLFMALTARREWDALRERSMRQLTITGDDPVTWLAHGVAAHRLGDATGATLAFDSALAFLSPPERARLTRVSRILLPQDSARYERMTPASQRALERVFWAIADPLAVTPGNEYRLEFLARVAEAELRWSSDDFDLHGADTDRGQIWVRYGPPSIVASFAPNTEATEECRLDDIAGPSPPSNSRDRMYDPEPERMELLCSGSGEVGSPLLVWNYPAARVHFVFRTPPTYGVASYAGPYAEVARNARSVASAGWTNLPIARHQIDSVVVVVSRFRGPGDSTDALIVAELPLDSLVPDSARNPLPLDVAFSAYDGRGDLVQRDSTRSIVDPATSPPRLRAWRKRLHPGSLIYRVEALQPGTMRAARGLGEMSNLPWIGFGVSDLMLAERVQPRDEKAERWSDFVVTPSIGSFPRGAPVGLLWETYWLTAQDGVNRYRVTIAFESELPEGAAGLAARVVGGARNILGLSTRGDAKLQISYERDVAAKLAYVDYLSLDLASSPAGLYRIRLSVTDLVTQRTETTERRIRIVETK